MLRKKISKSFITLVLAFTALVIPISAHAISAEQLLVLTDKANKLCAASSNNSDYTPYCAQATSYQNLAKAAFAKPESERNAYIKSQGGDSLNAKYLTAVDTYNKAVAKGDIESSASSGASSFDGDCNNGGVKISIGVNGTNECVGGNGVNPIYAYLRGIIILLGGAIGLAVVITIIVAGIQYSSSAGNPANITKAKERLTNAVIGLVLYLFLAAILRYLVPQIFV